MKDHRSIETVVKGRDAVDGAGVKLVRLFGHQDAGLFDPFLLMDAFDSDKPEDYVKGFPWHPHRGIETITYLLDGHVEHGDSLGNSGRIRAGDCQWMTAGSGIIHQEMPVPPGRMLGVQVWLNLPAKKKMCEPAYGDILSKNVPSVMDQGCEVRVIAGELNGVKGAFEGRHIKPRFIDVSIPLGATWEIETEFEHTLYTYTFSGSGTFGADEGKTHAEHVALLFGKGRGLKVTAGADGLRFIMLCGPPLKEPIAAGGPIVMNTKDELDTAFRELDLGTFIKHRI